MCMQNTSLKNKLYNHLEDYTFICTVCKPFMREESVNRIVFPSLQLSVALLRTCACGHWGGGGE